MSDYGSNVADKAIKDIERKIRQIYKQAQKELTEKLNDFLAKKAIKIQQKQKELADKLITEQEYKNWLKGQLFMEKQWKDKLDQATKIMNSANEQAAKIVHQGKLNVFAENYNYSAYEAEKEIGKSIFNLYSTESVAKLVKDDSQILPEWKIDQKKDYKWNYAKANNAVTQGIIQGEGVDEITDRLITSLCTQNENKMRTFARTAVTGAQNSGRMEMMHDAIEDGIKMKKKWLATLDDRTREAHRDLDGQVKDVDEPFEVEFDGDNYEIEYPGDPKADACMVYNCRCTLVYVYEGIDQKSIRRDSEGNEIKDMTYREWEAWKNGNGKIKEFTFQDNPSIIVLDLQKFAEKDLKKQSESSLLKGIEALEQRISDHEEKIKEPDKLSYWNDLSKKNQEGLLKHWKKEAQNFRESIKNRQEELERRKKR